MELLIEKLGMPSYLYFRMGTPEEFLKQAESGEEGLSNYDLAWVFDDYVLAVNCSDGWFYEKNTFTIKYIYYCTREFWDLTKDEKGYHMYQYENQMDKIF